MLNQRLVREHRHHLHTEHVLFLITSHLPHMRCTICTHHTPRSTPTISATNRAKQHLSYYTLHSTIPHFDANRLGYGKMQIHRFIGIKVKIHISDEGHLQQAKYTYSRQFNHIENSSYILMSDGAIHKARQKKGRHRATRQTRPSRPPPPVCYTKRKQKNEREALYIVCVLYYCRSKLRNRQYTSGVWSSRNTLKRFWLFCKVTIISHRHIFCVFITFSNVTKTF